MNYEEMRQWRDIAEFLSPRYYKFMESGIELAQGFSLLAIANKPHRLELWSRYMLQICQFSPHPYSFYHKVKKRNLEWGWRLLPDWEAKIDFLEQITLFNRNPEDLPQPWKAKIWEAMFKREYGHINSDFNLSCPLGLICKDMSGAFAPAECDNFQTCDRVRASI